MFFSSKLHFYFWSFIRALTSAVFLDSMRILEVEIIMRNPGFCFLSFFFSSKRVTTKDFLLLSSSYLHLLLYHKDEGSVNSPL